MFNLWNRKRAEGLLNSSLYDETTFYKAFLRDLDSCTKEAIIVCPFVTNSRMQVLRPVLQKLIGRKVKVYVITRHPSEHEEGMGVQAEGELAELEIMGVKVVLTKGNYHQKVVILDRQILFEGSLNVMSQVKSREVMRRIENNSLATEMFKFLGLKRFI